MAADIGSTVSLFGIYGSPNTTSLLPTLQSTFILSQLILPDQPIAKYHYVMKGCYRDPAWPIVFQPLSWMWLFGLAPLFIFSLASLNGQRCNDWRRMLVMVLFGCCSFTGKLIFLDLLISLISYKHIFKLTRFLISISLTEVIL